MKSKFCFSKKSNSVNTANKSKKTLATDDYGMTKSQKQLAASERLSSVSEKRSHCDSERDHQVPDSLLMPIGRKAAIDAKYAEKTKTPKPKKK